jgi:hypothetical protein
MFRFIALGATSILMMANGFAQSPGPSITPSASGPPAPTKSATPAPSPSGTPTTQELINSLGQSDLQATITLLKNNFTDPDAINETELSRATLEGLLVRQPRGLMLLPGRETAPPAEPAFYAEIFEGHIGYLRPADRIFVEKSGRVNCRSSRQPGAE